MTARLIGKGLFTSADAAIAIEPGGSGLRFITGGREVPALLSSRTDTPFHPAFAQAGARSTNLALPGTDAPAVLTTEHVLAACAAMGVWDAALNLEGPEVPIDDGSAQAFVELLSDAPQRTPDPIQLTEPITIKSGSASITATPVAIGQPATYTYKLDYQGQAPIPPQQASWALGDREGFITGIAPARTFSLRAEAEAMRAAGLFKAFTPADLLVVDDDGQPIDNQWRFVDEPARHKLLDVIGDLALLGAPLHADVVASRSGHALNHQLAGAVLAQAQRAQR